MNYLVGLLIVVLGVTLIISGVTGTTAQLYGAVTGRGDANRNNTGGGGISGMLPPGMGAGALGGISGMLPPGMGAGALGGTAPGAAFNGGMP